MAQFKAYLLLLIITGTAIGVLWGCGKELLPPTNANGNGAVAGSGTAGAANGTGTAATFNGPFGIAAGADGNLYVADLGNNLIRKIAARTVVTTLAGRADSAGYADGQDTMAFFNQPFGVAADAAGNVFVADAGNNRIRKVTPGGLVSTFAGTGTAGQSDGADTATFNFPESVAIDHSGNLYVADYNNNLVRKISPAGVVSTLAGSGAEGADDGAGTKASFNSPGSLAVDAAGNVYVTDNANNLIRKITPDGTVSTLAGSGSSGAANGKGAQASFNSPFGIAVDAAGNIFVADAGNNLVRKITPDGTVSTFAGGNKGAANGNGSAATFNIPAGLAIDAAGNVYVADEGNNLIRMITRGGAVTTLATLRRGNTRIARPVN